MSGQTPPLGLPNTPQPPQIRPRPHWTRPHPTWTCPALRGHAHTSPGHAHAVPRHAPQHRPLLSCGHPVNSWQSPGRTRCPLASSVPTAWAGPSAISPPMRLRGRPPPLLQLQPACSTLRPPASPRPHGVPNHQPGSRPPCRPHREWVQWVRSSVAVSPAKGVTRPCSARISWVKGTACGHGNRSWSAPLHSAGRQSAAAALGHPRRFGKTEKKKINMFNEQLSELSQVHIQTS